MVNTRMAIRSQRPPVALTMRLALSAASIFAALALTGCGSGSDEAATTDGGATTGGQTVEIRETEFALDPSSVQVDETGTVTFRVTNDGAIAHALEVDGDDFEEETGTIEPGDPPSSPSTSARRAPYELYCPIGDHREQGMEGELVVGSAGAGGTGTMGDDDEDDDDDGEGTSTSGGSGYQLARSPAGNARERQGRGWGPCPPGSNSRAMPGTETTPRTLGARKKSHWSAAGHVTSSQRLFGDQTRSWKRLSPVKSACLLPSSTSQTVEESVAKS